MFTFIVRGVMSVCICGVLFSLEDVDQRELGGLPKSLVGSTCLLPHPLSCDLMLLHVSLALLC